MVAGQSLQAVCLTLSGGGCLQLSYWILIFSASQLLLCLLPDINSLAAVTALGAATTLAFSLLATLGSALHGGCGRRGVGVGWACTGANRPACLPGWRRT